MQYRAGVRPDGPIRPYSSKARLLRLDSRASVANMPLDSVHPLYGPQGAIAYPSMPKCGNPKAIRLPAPRPFGPLARHTTRPHSLMATGPYSLRAFRKSVSILYMDSTPGKPSIFLSISLIGRRAGWLGGPIVGL